MIVLAIDPGVTTGWAVLNENGMVMDTGNLLPEDVEEGIRGTIDAWHKRGYSICGVVERFPLTSQGSLGTQLREVVLTIDAILVGAGIKHEEVTPGVWKTSSVPESPKEWAGRKLTPHQRDAIRMGRYVIRRGRTWQ